MSIQYMVLGFEPMTFRIRVPPLTSRPGLPPKVTVTLFTASEFEVCKVNFRVWVFLGKAVTRC